MIASEGLHVARRGASGPPVVLLHGLFGSNENLGGLARALGEHFDVSAIDLPNHGRSAHTARATLSEKSASISRWMADNVSGAAHLVGHSLGGKVAMELALTSPHLVERLVVMDISPRAYTPHHHKVFEGLAAVEPSSLESRADADARLAKYVEEPPVRSFLLKNLVRNPAGYTWRMHLSALERDYLDLLRENTAAVFNRPTLFLRGGNSSYIQERDRQPIESRFPKAQSKTVMGAGHWLHAEKPAVVARVINEFLLKEVS